MRMNAGAAPPQPQRSANLVLSTQRSGLNWVRYCVEALTGRRTPGLPLLVQAPLVEPTPFDRTHDAQGITTRADSSVAWVVATRHDYRRALLLVRDYRETFVRHAQGRIEEMANFVGNIQWFDGFAGERLVAHYEDFTQDPRALERLLAFLGVERSLEGFDLARHMECSRALYDRNQAGAGGSMTRADPTNMRFHQARASTTDLHRWEDWMRDALGPLFEPYLGRYA
jgi:hypothetical protein